MRVYKFRLYPNKTQRQEMQTHLWLSKNLWNDGLELAKQLYQNYQKFPTRQTYQEISKNSGLHSQVAQDVFIRLVLSIKAKVRRKKIGLKGGFPRFKNIDRVKSLHYPQSGFKIIPNKKLKVSPFGLINVKLHREIEGKIKTLTLKREASGKWFAILTVETETTPIQKNNGSQVGIDLGLINFAVLSDGTAIKNPRHLRKYEDRLAFLQRKKDLKKGSKNRQKARRKVAIVHEKVRNARRDFLHKLSHKLVHSHSLLALEDLASQEMAERQFGKSITDAGWSAFISMLSYKAESAGSRVILVNPENTTKECSGCGILVKKDLWERQHNCPSCGLSINRDYNAAINILNRATVGTTGSNACGDVAIATPMNQETTPSAQAKLG
ncbi:MAG: RNA-guided endonuclease TnpB family protein [Candidatus Micrarchaeota archaeon]